MLTWMIAVIVSIWGCSLQRQRQQQSQTRTQDLTWATFRFLKVCLLGNKRLQPMELELAESFFIMYIKESVTIMILLIVIFHFPFLFLLFRLNVKWNVLYVCYRRSRKRLRPTFGLFMRQRQWQRPYIYSLLCSILIDLENCLCYINIGRFTSCSKWVVLFFFFFAFAS